MQEAMESEPIASGGMEGAWDHARRIRELEADGVAGEVIFPNGVPLSGLGVDAEVELEGARAYNRRWNLELS